MRVVLAGAERTSYRNILLANGVKRLALNISEFHVPTTKELDLKEKFDGNEIYVYPSEGDKDLDGFDSFVREFADDLTMVVGMPGYDGSWLGSKYYPIWNDAQDLERLAYLCEKVGRVAISSNGLTRESMARIRQLKHRWKCSIVGILSSPDKIESIDWDYVIVSGWKGVVRYGETQVWDGYKLHRYPAQQKESARRASRVHIARLGCDYEEVMEDNVEEVAKLAIRSWLEWEMTTFHGGSSTAYDPIGGMDDEERAGGQTDEIATSSPDLPHGGNLQTLGDDIAISPPQKRNPDERRLLPILGLEETPSEEGDDDETPGNRGDSPDGRSPVITKAKGTLRNCDNCYLAPRCPAMRVGAECAYEIPVVLESKEQIMALLRVLMEIQGDRVMFAAFAESLEGQGMDPQLSKEMDRLINMVEKVKDIADTREMVRVHMEARGGAGVLSRIFGEKAGAQARQLDQPLDSNKAAELLSGFGPDDTIQDAEVIEDGQDK